MKGIKLLVWFHGHKCPMSTIGYKAGILAKKLLNLKRSDYKNAFVTVFFRSCAIDGVQIAFPATCGNNNLLIIDEKKMVFWFENRKKGIKLEIALSKDLVNMLDNYSEIRTKASIDPSLSKFMRKKYKELYNFVLNQDSKNLFLTKFL